MADQPLALVKMLEEEIPLVRNIKSSIMKSTIARRKESKQNMVQILHSRRKFTVLPHEDPQVHLQNFIEITATNITRGISSDNIRLFPFHSHY